MTQAILYLTDKDDVRSARRFLEDATDTNSNVYVLLNQKKSGRLISLSEPLQNRIIPFWSDIICQMEYKPIGDSLVPGNAHFPVLRFYKEYPNYDYYWVVEDDVRYMGVWRDLFGAFANENSDLLVSYITRYCDDTAWTWWYTFSSAGEMVRPSDMVRSFNPIYRLSNRAIKAIHEKMAMGWSGHFEVLIPTILSLQGMKMSDLGGICSSCYKNDDYRLYDKNTMSHVPLRIQDWKQNMLYHPVKEKQSAEQPRRNCVISAVGQNSLHRRWIGNAGNRSFDLHLIVYDNSFGRFYNDADYLSYKKGYKLKLVYDYLNEHPEYLEWYDYFFIPDDDILTSSSEIDELFDIMDEYQLKIAQPALRHSYYTHPLTLRKPLTVLRYVNFVEMMLPCFNREALRCVLETFNANESGWGVEYHWHALVGGGKKDMAVIDVVAMQHTQPVKQGRTGNLLEMQKYVTKHHLTLEQNEYGCVLNHLQNATIERYLYAAKSIQAIQTIAHKLLIRLRSGEFRRLGLDGQAGIALLLNEASYMTEDKTLKDYALRVVEYAETLSSEGEQQDSVLWAKKHIASVERTLGENMYCKMLKICEDQYEKFGTDMFLAKATGWNILHAHFYSPDTLCSEEQ